MGMVADPQTPPPLEGGGWGEGSAGVKPEPGLVTHARDMRRDPTPAEKRIWGGLRRHQLGGLKFRRQMPLGPYIADFYCAAAKLVVELDGISHIDSRTDDTRDAWMQSRGLLVLRFSNFEALSNAEGVLAAIGLAAAGRLVAETRSTPPPTPLPQGEGESDGQHPRHAHV